MLEVAAKLAAKAMGEGKRLLIVGSAELLDEIDQSMWLEEGFLAHGFAGGLHDCEQPILLSQVIAPENGATILMLLGTGLPPDFQAFERILTLFEDGSKAHIRARSDWKAVSARDAVERSYWQQRLAGGWEKRA